MPRASVLIPIHNKPRTLRLTVDTVLRQSVEDLEVLLIGDGVTDEVRTVAEELAGSGGRVRFLDFPKGPHHGERHRHDAVEAARSDAIFYLCDDDLLLPDHVADLLDLLEDHTFVQSLNGEIRPDEQVRFYAADLGDPEVVALHLSDDIRFCSVSITGTAHTRALYAGADDRWDTTPPGWWPDHWQFRKLMRHPSFSGATSMRMTALQFPTSKDGRDTWSDKQRLAELEPWHRLVVAPGAQAAIDRRCETARRAQLIEDRAKIAFLERDLWWLRGQHESLAEGHVWLRSKYDEIQGDLEWLRGQQGDLERLRREHDVLTANAEIFESTLAAVRGTVEHQEAVIARLREKVSKKKETIERLRDRLR